MGRKERHREYMKARRSAAEEGGIVLPWDTWAKRNPEKHAARVARWRAANAQKASGITRSNQAGRRATPWGKITNRIQPIINHSIRNGFPGTNSKYCRALGYTWSDLKAHLQAQFLPGMCWDNWGDIWEIDHIRPISDFRYDSLEHPDFLECWALSNLRPLWREANIKKFTKAA